MISGSLAPVTNREDFNLQIELWDDEAGEPIDVSDASEVVIEIVPRNTASARDYGYREHGRAVLSATLSAGQVVSPETGVFECTFTASQMRGLCVGTYDIGGTVTKDDQVVQFLLGTLPVLDGVVSR